MAMEIANHIAQEKHADYQFKSAGLVVVGNRIDENINTVLGEIGIESNWTPTGIDAFDIRKFDAVHVMTQRLKVTLCSYYRDIDLDGKITVLGIDNPSSRGIDAYRSCRDELVEFYSNYIVTGRTENERREAYSST